MRPITITLLSLFAVLPLQADEGRFAPIYAHADSLARVEFVLRVQMEGAADQELESETTCNVITADGMVLCSNSELGGSFSLLGRMMGRGNVSATPTNIEVFLGDAQEGLTAQLITRDTDRDLAWLQIERAEGDDSPLAFLDLGTSSTVAPGDTIVALRRMGAFFGREPLAVEGVIGATPKRPRLLYAPATPLNVGFGVPVFDTTGTFVGVTVLQLPDGDETAALFRNPLSFLQTSALNDLTGGLVLPAEDLVRATALAQEIAAEEEAAE